MSSSNSKSVSCCMVSMFQTLILQRLSKTTGISLKFWISIKEVAYRSSPFSLSADFAIAEKLKYLVRLPSYSPVLLSKYLNASVYHLKRISKNFTSSSVLSSFISSNHSFAFHPLVSAKKCSSSLSRYGAKFENTSP